ncbi:MAG TPA: protein-disulfide reductase DsbD domain-containing protein, partial [Alphaproteobacteria bacterium]|nr:protein-disulfide reductase DsbD domain-containing protein [Alphaproteobacteria bacterium]
MREIERIEFTRMRYVIRSTMPMLFFALLLLPASAARAQVGAYQRDEAVAVRLISGVEGTGARAAIPLGLQIRLAPGWHTYWRSPGEAGFPPRLKWQGSDNLKTATLLYPAPKRYAAYGIETIGYEGDVVLPIGAAVQKPGEALDLHAALDLLVCSNICVPKHFTLALDVPKGPATPSAAAALIDHYRALIPGTAVQSGLSITGLS